MSGATPPSQRTPLAGGCLCSAVRFEVTEPFLYAAHCHCSRCRRHSGAFGSTHGRVRRAGFRLLRGADVLHVHRPPDGAVKAFCGECGSSLFGGAWPDGDEILIRFGALDGDPGIRPSFRAHVASRAPWDVIPDDGLPRFAEGNPDVGGWGPQRVPPA